MKYIAVTKHHFNTIKVIGKGGLGRVWKVQKKKSKRIYALKEMSKQRIILRQSVHSVMYERKHLQMLKHE